MTREATWLDGTGGHLVLELVNSVSWRGDPARFADRLDGPAALAAWTTAYGLPVPADATARDLARLRELREAVHALVALRGGWGGADDAALATLQAAARAATTRATLTPDGRWHADPRSAQGLHDHLALAAVDLLATADPARLRTCDAHDCGWVFLDTSRSGTRRWCDPAGCGNRARARRHHDRHRRRST